MDPAQVCGLDWNLPGDLELGPLYRLGQCVAHLHCLMFSSGLIQGGEEGDGILGFLPDDITRELQRGAKLKCAFCKGSVINIELNQKLNVLNLQSSVEFL